MTLTITTLWRKVAQARKRPFDQVEPLAQGRVWLGDQAKGNGLVDELGGIDRALELVKQKARIPASENVAIVMYPPRRSILEVLFGKVQDNATDLRLRRLVKDWPPELWGRGALLRIAPFMLSGE